MTSRLPFEQPSSNYRTLTETTATHNNMEYATHRSRYSTGRITQSTPLRHKLSLRDLHPHLDSSESVPSSHDSILNAVLCASAESIASDPVPNQSIPRSSTPRPENPPPPPPPHNPPIQSENLIPRPQYINNPIHHPTYLTPITERHSLSTLQTTSIKTFLSHKASASTLRSHLPRRKTSFSLSDIPFFPSFHHHTHETSSSSTSIPPPIPLHPLQPLRSPPNRAPTPPGLPTFGTDAAMNYRLPPPKLRFRDFWRLTTPAEEEWRRQTWRLPKGAVMRGEGSVVVRGRMVKVASGHLGAAGEHPFMRGAVTEIRNRGSGIGPDERLREEVGHTRSAEVVQQDVGMNKEKGFWEMVREWLCWVCCGVEDGDGGAARPAMVNTLVGGGEVGRVQWL